MNKQVLLGIDIGTSQSKGVLVSPNGKILAFAAADHDTVESQPGYYEHDAEQIWVHDCKQLIRELKEKSGIGAEEIVSVCISAIGPCVLPVDQSGTPLCPAILYGIDTRATREIQELNEAFGEDYFVEHGGNTLSTQAAGPKIAWLRRHRPEVFRQAACFLTATSYLVYRLTGAMVMDYYTACAGYMPLFDYKAMTWDDEMCEKLGCRGRLPELHWTGDLAAGITQEAAEEFGLRAGTPVCVGTCDAAAEAVSVGVLAPGQTMLMLGSTAFLISVLDHPVSDRRLWAAPYLFPGTYALLGGMGSTGSLTKWFLQQLSRETQAEAEQQRINPYALLAQKASEVPPGCDGLLALPYFCGERTPLNDPHAKGVFFGLTLHHTQAHLYRALLEGTAFGIRDNLEAMQQSGCRVQALHTVGGGAKNSLWTRIISDVTGCKQIVNQVTVGASYGDAFLAGLLCGLVPGREHITDWIQQANVLVPDPETQAGYQTQFQKFKQVYGCLRDLMQA